MRHSQFIRGLAIAAASAVMAIASGPVVAQANSNTIAIQEHPGIWLNLLSWVAQSQGFFNKHNVEVKFVPLSSAAPAIAAIEGGSLNLGINNTDILILNNARGLDLVMVLGNWGQQFTLFARNGLELPNLKAGYPTVAKDFVGKKIGVSGRGSGTEYAMRATLSEAGVDPESVQYIAVGGTPGQIPALVSGSVDIVVVPIEGVAVLKAMKLGTPIVDFQKGEGPKSFQLLTNCYNGYYGKRSWANANAALLQRFTLANREAEAWARDPKNLDALTTLMLDKSPKGGVPDPRAMAADFLKTAPYMTKFDKACVANWNALLVKTKLVDKAADINSVVWEGLKN